MPTLNWRFNLVELAGSVGASGITNYKLLTPQPSPQAMNRAEKWRRKHAGATVQFDNEINNYEMKKEYE